jgi:hypothetical protein
VVRSDPVSGTGIGYDDLSVDGDGTSVGDDTRNEGDLGIEADNQSLGTHDGEGGFTATLDQVKGLLDSEDWSKCYKYLATLGAIGLAGVTIGAAAIPSFPMLATAIEAGITQTPYVGEELAWAFFGLRTFAVARNIPDLVTGKLFGDRYRLVKGLLDSPRQLDRLQGRVACLVVPLFTAAGSIYTFDQHSGISQALLRTFPAFYCGVPEEWKYVIEVIGSLALLGFNLAWGVDGSLLVAKLVAHVCGKFLPTAAINALVGYEVGKDIPIDPDELEVGKLLALVALAGFSGAPAIAAAKSGTTMNDPVCGVAVDTRLAFESYDVWKLWAQTIVSFSYGASMNASSSEKNSKTATEPCSLLLKTYAYLPEWISNAGAGLKKAFVNRCCQASTPTLNVKRNMDNTVPPSYDPMGGE